VVNAAGSYQLAVISAAAGVTACEYRFDFTPVKLVTGIITEEGILSSSDVAAYIKGLRDSLT